MEGVAFSLRDCADICHEIGADIDDMMACGGGGTSAVWRQMLADLYNCTVKTVSSKEGPALGAAILAMVGAGIYKTVPEACSQSIKINKTQAPIKENVNKYEDFYNVYKKLYPALKQQYKEIAQI